MQLPLALPRIAVKAGRALGAQNGQRSPSDKLSPYYTMDKEFIRCTQPFFERTNYIRTPMLRFACRNS